MPGQDHAVALVLAPLLCGGQRRKVRVLRSANDLVLTGSMVGFWLACARLAGCGPPGLPDGRPGVTREDVRTMSLFLIRPSEPEGYALCAASARVGLTFPPIGYTGGVRIAIEQSPGKRRSFDNVLLAMDRLFGCCGTDSRALRRIVQSSSHDPATKQGYAPRLVGYVTLFGRCSTGGQAQRVPVEFMVGLAADTGDA